MSDLIDRQALLKQIDIDSDGEPGYYGDTWKFIDTIKSMPSTLSTNLAEVGTDCISRQAAIEALDEQIRQCDNALSSFDISIKDGFAVKVERASLVAFRETLEYLPPAQPETAKRIVGKSRDGMTLWYQCDMCNEPVDVQDNFCRECGRRLIDE